MYLEYTQRAHQLHKGLRVALDDGEPEETVHRHLCNLEAFLADELATAFQSNCLYLDRLCHVGNPLAPLPRIAVKAAEKVGGREMIFDVYRHGERDGGQRQALGYLKGAYPLPENTGFYHVAKSGTYFLEQNLPRAVHSGYINPRLDLEKARSYKRSVLKDLFGHADPAWESCWLGYESDAGKLPAGSCYKSTLIIPIAISAKQMGPAVLAHIRGGLPGEGSLKSLIFAYLCFDHVNKHYFMEHFHVPIGYMFADLISLYFFTRWTLVAVSSTFERAVVLLKRRRDLEGENAD